MDVAAPVTFVIGGDTRKSFRPFSIMEFMRAAQPDFFIYLGDTIYADKGRTARTLSDYWGKYRENRDRFAQRLLASTSLYVLCGGDTAAEIANVAVDGTGGQQDIIEDATELGEDEDDMAEVLEGTVKDEPDN